MNHHLRQSVVAAFCLLGSLLLHLTWASDESLQALYQNPIRFRQLSLTSQRLLERKLAARIPHPESVIVHPASRILHRASLSPSDLVNNAMVNDSSADISSRDTQSTWALVLGSGSNIIAAFLDSGSFSGSNNHFTGFSSSGDSGSSFTDHGSLPASTEGDAGLPVLARDQTSNTIYLATTGFTTNEFIQVFRSINNGTSFNAPVNATPGFAGTGDFQDKPWIAVDNLQGPGGEMFIWYGGIFPLPGPAGFASPGQPMAERPGLRVRDFSSLPPALPMFRAVS